MSRDADAELRTLRELVADLEARVDALEAALVRDGDALLVQTVQVTRYPTVPGVFYGVQRLLLGGAEVEGGAGSTTAADTFYALHVGGTTAPPQGTKALAIHVPDRWCFHY